MTKPYTSKELKSKLAELGLTQQWLAEKSHVSRQTVNGVLTDKAWGDRYSGNEYLHRLLWTYIINDYVHSLAYEDF